MRWYWWLALWFLASLILAPPVGRLLERRSPMTCDVYNCQRLAHSVLLWPEETEKTPLHLCYAHKLWYAEIIGPHMRLQALERIAD